MLSGGLIANPGRTARDLRDRARGGTRRKRSYWRIENRRRARAVEAYRGLPACFRRRQSRGRSGLERGPPDRFLESADNYRRYRHGGREQEGSGRGDQNTASLYGLPRKRRMQQGAPAAGDHGPHHFQASLSVDEQARFCSGKRAAKALARKRRGNGETGPPRERCGGKYSRCRGSILFGGGRPHGR